MKFNKYSFPIAVFAIIAIFSLGLFVGKAVSVNANVAGIQSTTQFPDLDELKSLIDKYFIGEQPSSADAKSAILGAYVSALKDKYSFYLSPSDAKDYFASSAGSYEGIGIELGYNGENTYIGNVFKDQPAFTAGIKAGEIILKIDGKSVLGLRPEELVSKIKGPSGSKVSLTLYSKESNSERVVEVERKLVDLDNITYEMLDNKVAKINITKFTEGKTEGNGLYEFISLWDKVVKEVQEQSPTAIVIDLRNNPGGYVEGVKYVIEEFLTSDKILMQEKTVEGNITEYKDTRTGKFESIPVVILVNENSASASEIFAASLQENGRAKVVGMPTIGKGVEGVLLNMSDGALVVLTNKYWLTPKGNQITAETPIKPDVEVKEPDKQLIEALKLIN